MNRKYSIGLIVGSVVLLALISTPGVTSGSSGRAQTSPSSYDRKALASVPISSTFTYQGQIKQSNIPVTGSCDMVFRLYDDPNAGNLIGNAITETVPITNGLFTVQLNFGDYVFDSTTRWLSIAVDCGSGFALLTPRQLLTAAPYAAYAMNSGSAKALQGRPITATAPITDQVLKWNGSEWIPAPDNVSASSGYWSLIGNVGTTPSTNFLGTTDNVSLTMIVSGTIAFRLEPTALTPNVIGGYSGNRVTNGAWGATIGGGGANIGPVPLPTPMFNIVSDHYGTVGGGLSNQAGNDYYIWPGSPDDAAFAAVSGGYGNIASGYASTIGGGGMNYAHGSHSSIGGGSRNGTGNGTSYSTVGGGYFNRAEADYATIAGGGSTDGTYLTSNVVGAAYGTIGGGGNNKVGNSFSTIAGGMSNTTNGQYSTIPGGQANTAGGDYSFAAGRQAQALHAGTFVWADSTNAPITSTAENQFIVRASGGVTMYTNITSTIGATLPPGSGSWSSLSDRSAKSNFAAVDELSVLDRLAAIPIKTWSYNAQNPAIHHIGPMAQDFYAAFNVGEDDQHISVVDADGVALAAIKGLYRVVQEKDAHIAELEARLTRLERGTASASFNWLNVLSILIVGGAIGWLIARRVKVGGVA